MRAILLHILWYLGWLLAGAVLGLTVWLIWWQRDPRSLTAPSPLELIGGAVLSALAFVLFRACIAATGVGRARADRVILVALARCVLGGAAGWMLADVIRGHVKPGLDEWLD
jgi:hypothetical protein